MDDAHAAARLLLAIVLTVAAFAKLVDPAGARRAFIDLGGPAPLAAIGAWLLPAIEIATALALLSRPFHGIGAAVACALLAMFTVVLAVSLGRGGAPDCHCFGQLASAPVSGKTVGRSGALAALAGGLAIAAPGSPSPDIGEWLVASMPAGLAWPSIIVLVVGGITWGVAWARASGRRQAALLERVETLEQRGNVPPRDAPASAPTAALGTGLIVGAVAPAPFDLTGEFALLMFVSANCPPCEALAALVSGWRERLAGRARLVVIDRHTAEGRAVAESYGARWTPSGVLVDARGRVASTLRHGGDGIKDLVASLSEDVHAETGRGAIDLPALHRRLGARLGNTETFVGDPAPAVTLVDAAGRPHPLAADTTTLLLFWDPACPYCQGMADDLRAFEEGSPDRAPRILFVIARSAAVASAAQSGFVSPSVFDPASTAAPLFGARGTPSAVLVDHDGRIASTVATGKDAVLSLLVPASEGARASGPRATREDGLGSRV